MVAAERAGLYIGVASEPTDAMNAQWTALATKEFNAVSPGITETPMIGAYSEAQRAAMKQRFPLGRFAAPEEIANAGLYLISDKASFMTGEVMHVNGGSNFG